MKFKRELFLFGVLLGIVLLTNSVSAELLSGFSSASYSSYHSHASLDTYYSSSQMSIYWPMLADQENCQAREDLLLQVAPGGC